MKVSRRQLESALAVAWHLGEIQKRSNSLAVSVPWQPPHWRAELIGEWCKATHCPFIAARDIVLAPRRRRALTSQDEKGLKVSDQVWNLEELLLSD